MNLWHIGFALLVIGVGIPVVYSLYKFVLASIPWYGRLSIICVVVGCIVLLAAAAKDRMQAPSPEEKY